MTVIDTNDNTSTHLALLKSRGVTAVGRYYSSSAWKRLTRPEAKTLSAAGIRIFTVFENSGDPHLSAGTGIHDAQIALQQAKAVGQPKGSTIYFALEHLPHGYDASHVPGIKAYIQGVKQVLDGSYQIGVYSDGVVLDALLQAGLCRHAWLSASTSFPGSKAFDHSGRWSLAQRKVDLNWSGLSVDTNDARDEFGAFVVDGASPVAEEAVEAVDEAVAAAEPAAAPAAVPPPRFDVVAATVSRMSAVPAAAVPMRALRLGSQGLLVEAWQNFLVGKGFDPGGADGDFGDKTHTATMAFQSAQGLKADGVVGQQTFAKAMTLGFHLVEEPDSDDTGTNFPPRPNFQSLQSTRQRMALFGHFDFVSAPQPDNVEHIRILGSWVADNIVAVPIPQLSRTSIAHPPATIRFHKLAAAQLRALWAAWESAGLLDLILTYDDSFVPRFKRGQANGGPEALSNHTFGTAFDINEHFNKFGTTPALVGQRGSVRKLVTIANQHGFYWGGHFSERPDGMHFEVAILQP